MTGILSLHDLRNAFNATPDYLPEPAVESLSDVRQWDLDQASYHAWLNAPGSADEWPWAEPVGREDDPFNDDQIPW